MNKSNKNRLSKKDKRMIKKAVFAAAKKSDLTPSDLTALLIDSIKYINGL